MTGRSLSALGFLQIYRNKRAQQRKFYAYIFSEQLFEENICLKFPLLGSFLVINLKKPQSKKWSTCQSFLNFTLIKPSKRKLVFVWIIKELYGLDAMIYYIFDMKTTINKHTDDSCSLLKTMGNCTVCISKIDLLYIL